MENEEWVAITKVCKHKESLMFAYKQRKKYGNPVSWISSSKGWAVGIPKKESLSNAYKWQTLQALKIQSALKKGKLKSATNKKCNKCSRVFSSTKRHQPVCRVCQNEINKLGNFAGGVSIGIKNMEG